jgi:hypothetical protein
MDILLCPARIRSKGETSKRRGPNGGIQSDSLPLTGIQVLNTKIGQGKKTKSRARDAGLHSENSVLTVSQCVGMKEKKSKSQSMFHSKQQLFWD